jgi:hypothetical protein
MTRKRLAVALVLLAVAVAAVLLLRSRQRRVQRGPSEHAEGIDYAMSPVLAMFKAPEGSTPCETAYNAFHAFEVAQQHKGGGDAPWGALPERSVFLARCATLPEQEQLCFQPRYLARHHAECDPLVEHVDPRHHPLFAPVQDAGGP